MLKTLAKQPCSLQYTLKVHYSNLRIVLLCRETHDARETKHQLL